MTGPDPSNVAGMALQPLTNAGWGFETNCFVCEPSNLLGLRIPYFLDEEALGEKGAGGILGVTVALSIIVGVPAVLR